MSAGDREISRLLGLAAAAEGRASAEHRRADRAEWLSRQGATSLRSMHRQLAELHRLNADRHRAAARLYHQLARRASTTVDRRLTLLAADAVGSPSLSLVMLTDDGAPAELVATDVVAGRAQELELTHGEGPLREVMLGDEAVVAAASDLDQRWPCYAAAVSDLGVRGVVAVPLRYPGAVLGALGLFTRDGKVSSVDLVQEVADILVDVIVQEAPELAASAEFGASDLGHVHQAAGMVGVQLACTPQTALALIRARAFAEETTMGTVADQVIAREIELSL